MSWRVRLQKSWGRRSRRIDEPGKRGIALPEHGFTSVDRQPDPGLWIACLDRLRGEPFYIAYKRRLIELLNVRPGGRYLDIGAGTGEDAAHLAELGASEVIALDSSPTMSRICRDRHVGVEPMNPCGARSLRRGQRDGASLLGNDRIACRCIDGSGGATLARDIRCDGIGGAFSICGHVLHQLGNEANVMPG